MNINTTINGFCGGMSYKNVIFSSNKSSQIIDALQIYLKNEYSQYYKDNNFEKIFALAKNDDELRAKLLKSINKFFVM